MFTAELCLIVKVTIPSTDKINLNILYARLLFQVYLNVYISRDQKIQVAGYVHFIQLYVAF